MSNHSAIRKASGVDWRRAPGPLGGLVLVAERDGEPVHWHLGGGAEQVWLLVDGKRDSEVLVEALRMRYPETDPETDVRQLLGWLEQEGLIELTS